jgi:hypothetical protein
MMLAYGEANYFRSDFDEKPEVVIMSCMYELSRFGALFLKSAVFL